MGIWAGWETPTANASLPSIPSARLPGHRRVRVRGTARLAGECARCAQAGRPPALEAARDLGSALREERLPGRPLRRGRLHGGARPQGPRALHGLARDRAQPRRQERLRRLLAQRRDRDLRPQQAHRHAAAAERDRRLHRRQRRRRLRQGDRARRPQLGRGQPRRPLPSTRPRGTATPSPSSAATSRPARSASSAAVPAASPGCPSPAAPTGRALVGPDVLVVSPDGRNVYVGSFFGNAVAVFARDRATGALTQPEGTAGCIAAARSSGCATGLGLEAPEGMAISADGDERLRRRRPLQRPRRLRSRHVHRHPHPGDRRQRLHRREPAHGLHHRRAAERRQRGGGQPR